MPIAEQSSKGLAIRWGSHREARENGYKPCGSCGETKPLSDFYKEATSTTGHSSHCKFCRYINQWRKYGVTPKTYREKLAAQSGKCLICHAEGTKAVPLVLDHCHDKHRVRGIICRRCNAGLGCFDDNPFMLSRAIHYLVSYLTSSEASQLHQLLEAGQDAANPPDP